MRLSRFEFMVCVCDSGNMWAQPFNHYYASATTEEGVEALCERIFRVMARLDVFRLSVRRIQATASYQIIAIENLGGIIKVTAERRID